MSERSAEHEVPKAAAGRRGLVLAACMMATFMTAVETTIVATAMPTIVADLGDFHLFSWVFAAYLLAQAVSIPIYGRLADLHGRKRIFILCSAGFTVASVLCRQHLRDSRTYIDTNRSDSKSRLQDRLRPLIQSSRPLQGKILE